MPPREPVDWRVEIVRSARRRRTVSAELRNGVLVIRAPVGMSDADLAPHIASLKQRLQRRVRRQRRAVSDEGLATLAAELNRKYFDGRLSWESIRYVGNMRTRYGSCTPTLGTIRISDRLAGMPVWVLEYVLVHELAHLLEANHGPRFWALVNRFPLAERARGYLMGAGMEEDET